MKTFQLNISESCYYIPDTLKVRGLLWSHKWFVLGENGYEELLTFLRTGVLSVFSNEKEEKGTWVYNTKNQSLALRGMKIIMINRMLRPFFWDGCLLVFKLNAVDEYLFLVNVDKARQLEMNPLDDFEAYANDTIEKQKGGKRRKPAEANASEPKKLKPLNRQEAKLPATEQVAAPMVEDPQTLLVENPGPMAKSNIKPIGQPEELPPEVFSLCEMEERIKQALEEQRIKLDEKWMRKLDDEKDKYNGALWIERKGVEERIEKALKLQARSLEVQTHNRIKEEKRNWVEQEKNLRERRMKKIREEVDQLKKKLLYEKECNRLSMNGNIAFEIKMALERQKEIFSAQFKAADLKIKALEKDLKITRSQLATVGKEQSGTCNQRDYSQLKKLLDEAINQCEEQAKEIESMNFRLFIERKKYNEDLLNEKKMFYAELKKVKKKSLLARIFGR